MVFKDGDDMAQRLLGFSIPVFTTLVMALVSMFIVQYVDQTSHEQFASIGVLFALIITALLILALMLAAGITVLIMKRNTFSKWFIAGTLSSGLGLVLFVTTFLGIGF